jgi:hypothetical protein
MHRADSTRVAQANRRFELRLFGPLPRIYGRGFRVPTKQVSHALREGSSGMAEVSAELLKTPPSLVWIYLHARDRLKNPRRDGADNER